MDRKKTAAFCIAIALACFSIAAETHSLRIGPNTTLSFEPGVPTLAPDAKLKLRKVVEQARAHGAIDKIELAVWSDNPAPRETEELPKADRTLANNRVQAIRAYLQSASQVSDIDAFNMAESANWLARTFRTAEAELKAEVGRGENRPGEFSVFRDHGKPSKAVVVVILK